MRKFAFTLWWMRASKLRFPDSTLAPMMSFLVSASSSPRSSGPELPIQVVQPNPTRWKPNRSRNGCSPVLVQVLAHDARAGRERRLHPRLDAEAPLDRVLRQQARGQHHRRVRGVGARGDGRDDDVAVRQLAGRRSARAVGPPEPSRFGVGRLFIISASVSVLVSFARPSGSVSIDCSPPPGRGAAGAPRCDPDRTSDLGDRLAVAIGIGEEREEALLEPSERDPVLWSLRAGDRRLHGGEIHVDDGRVVALAALRACRRAPGPGSSGAPSPRARRSGRSPGDSGRTARRRGRSRSSRRTRAPCSRASLGRARTGSRHPHRGTRRTCRRRRACRRSSVMRRTRSVAVAPSRRRPWRCTPTTSGRRR